MMADIDLNRERRKLSDILRELVALGEASPGPLSIGALVTCLGDRAFGAGIVFFALPNLIPLPPGSSTILSFPLFFITWQLMAGRQIMWIPKWISGKTLELKKLTSGLTRVIDWVTWIERYLKPRMTFLSYPKCERITGLACFVLTVILALPIPLMNMLPSVALVFFALGLIEQDGAAIVVGWVGTGLCFLGLFLLYNAIVEVALKIFQTLSSVLGG